VREGTKGKGARESEGRRGEREGKGGDPQGLVHTPHVRNPEKYPAIHRREQQVQELAKLSKTSRKTALCKLRNMGNHMHNISVVAEGTGDLVVTHHPNSEADAVSYVPCESCYAYVHKKHLYRHKCPVRGKSTGRVAAAASLLLPAITSSSGL